MRKRTSEVRNRPPKGSVFALDELAKSPTRYFDHPYDVLVDASLTVPAKTKILRAWELEARQLAVATEENMGGGEEPALADILKALRCLGAKPDRLSSPTKLGA